MDIIRNKLVDKQFSNVIISLDNNVELTTIQELLLTTSLNERNRLVADLYSFIMASGKATNFDVCDCTAKKNGLVSFECLLGLIHPKLAKHYSTEKDSIYGNTLNSIWSSWFDSIEHFNGIFCPVHICLQLCTEKDWEKEDTIKGGVLIIKTAIDIYKQLT